MTSFFPVDFEYGFRGITLAILSLALSFYFAGPFGVDETLMVFVGCTMPCLLYIIFRMSTKWQEELVAKIAVLFVTLIAIRVFDAETSIQVSLIVFASVCFCRAAVDGIIDSLFVKLLVGLIPLWFTTNYLPEATLIALLGATVPVVLYAFLRLNKNWEEQRIFRIVILITMVMAVPLLQFEGFTLTAMLLTFTMLVIGAKTNAFMTLYWWVALMVFVMMIHHRDYLAAEYGPSVVAVFQVAIFFFFVGSVSELTRKRAPNPIAITIVACVYLFLVGVIFMAPVGFANGNFVELICLNGVYLASTVVYATTNYLAFLGYQEDPAWP